jgi:hypothetical protein
MEYGKRSDGAAGGDQASERKRGAVGGRVGDRQDQV